MIKKLLVFLIIFLFVGAGVVYSDDNKIVDVITDYQFKPANNPLNPLACDHLAYVGGSGESCGLYEFTLNDPGNLTCIWPLRDSGNFIGGSTWTIDGRWLACEYGNGRLWEIDLETGYMTLIGGGGTGCYGMSWDPLENRLFATSGNALYEYNPDTGEQSYIGSHGSPSNIIGLAINSDGECYAWDNSFSTSPALYTVDLETGDAEIIGYFGMAVYLSRDGDFCKRDDILFLPAYDYSYSYLFAYGTGGGGLVDQFQEDVDVNTFVIPWNYPPNTPINPYPPSGKTGVCNNTMLSWIGGDPDGDNVWYDVYFGNSTPPPKNASNIPNTTYNPPGLLENCTTYYWQIVAKDIYGVYSEGPIWNFTTNCRPTMPIISGLTNGQPGEVYTYSFVSTDPEGDDIKFVIDWGDGNQEVTVFVPSGVEKNLSHLWADPGKYTIRAKAVDGCGAESDWGELQVNMPRDKILHHSLFLKFLDYFPFFQGLFNVLEVI